MPGSSTDAQTGAGSATVENQTTILTGQSDIKGTGFAKATHSLKALYDYVKAYIADLLTAARLAKIDGSSQAAGTKGTDAIFDDVTGLDGAAMRGTDNAATAAGLAAHEASQLTNRTYITTGIPNAAPGGPGGLPTVDASNHVAGVQGDTKQTGDNFARLGAPAGVSVSADIAAVKVDTGSLATQVGTAGAGLNDIPPYPHIAVGSPLPAGNTTYTPVNTPCDVWFILDISTLAASDDVTITLSTGGLQDVLWDLVVTAGGQLTIEENNSEVVGNSDQTLLKYLVHVTSGDTLVVNRANNVGGAGALAFEFNEANG